MKITKSQLREILKELVRETWPDDEELQGEVVEEEISVNVDKLLKNPKIKKLMQRLAIKKTQSQEAALKILNYFANNPHALMTLKKVAFESTTTSAVPGYQTPFAFKKKEDDEDD